MAISLVDERIDTDNLGIKGLFKVCRELQHNSARTIKERIIKENKNYSDFTLLMKFLFNNNITTGIDIKKLDKPLTSVFGMTIIPPDSFENLLEYIKMNNTGRDIDIATVRCAIMNLSGETENLESPFTDFLNEVVTKSLRLGIDVKTVNKVYGYNLIPVFDVQLGTPIEKCTLEPGTWFSLSHKLNGTRCVYAHGKLYSRNGKEYGGLQHIIADIQKEFNDDWVIDGELILKDRSRGDSESFQISTGIANSNALTKEELKLVIFDFIHKDEFDSGEGTIPYSHRKAALERVRTEIKSKGLENIEIVEFVYEGRDQSKIWELLDEAEANDWEGLMLNTDDVYKCKRVKSLMKVKKFFDIDLKCIGMEAGTGKLKNTLGAIICQYGSNTVKVGSGFTDELRNYYWNNQNEIVDKIVTVKYKEATKNKNGTESLQFPVFICVRNDKNEADC